MPDIDLEKFINEPIYAFDFQRMIGDVADFLDFSENNIELIYRQELQGIHKSSEREELPSDYRDHLEENAKYRFEVSLPLRVRYGAVLALITSVEWSVRIFEQWLKQPICFENKPKGFNETVYAISELQNHTGISSDPECYNTKDFIRSPLEIDDPIFSMMYLRGTVDGGQLVGRWIPPGPSPTNSVLLWPDAYKYFWQQAKDIIDATV